MTPGKEKPSHEQHREAAAKLSSIAAAVVTVSDTRTPETDTSGRRIRELLEAAGHRVVRHEIVPDEPIRIRNVLKGMSQSEDIHAIVFTGGTGIARRDTTVDVVEPMLDRALPGFGEVFRMLSWQEVGPPAILSRAMAGVCEGKIVFCLPGSLNAVEVAMERIIVPELAHLVWEVRR